MKIATHNGKFHSDDTFSVALLTLLYPDAEVIRTRDLERMKSCDIVLDVGGEYDKPSGRFDHHMPGGAGERPNGIRYSAFGLIWQAYGLQFCENNQELWRRIDEGFVASFDAYDNGQKTYKITTDDASVVELQDLFDKYLNPNIDESSELEDYDRAFFEAIPIAQLIIRRVTARKKAELASEEYYFSAWQSSPDKRYVILDKFATAGERAEDMTELLYTVYPAVGGQWQVKAMAKAKGTYETKKPLPQAWAGLTNGEFEEVTGIQDVVFCHNSLHLAGANTKEAVIKLMQIALL